MIAGDRLRRCSSLPISSWQETGEGAVQNFDVSGMTCEHCAQAVTNAVKSIDPGASVTVDVKSGRATVRGATVPTERIAAVIEAEGYGATPA